MTNISSVGEAVSSFLRFYHPSIGETGFSLHSLRLGCRPSPLHMSDLNDAALPWPQHFHAAHRGLARRIAPDARAADTMFASQRSVAHQTGAQGWSRLLRIDKALEPCLERRHVFSGTGMHYSSSRGH